VEAVSDTAREPAALMDSVRVKWDEEAEMLIISAIDPTGRLLIRNCFFQDLQDMPFRLWLGEKGSP
jgi:hypothetical protein